MVFQIYRVFNCVTSEECLVFFTGIFSSKVLNGILLYEVKGMSGSFSSDCKVLIRKAKY